MPPDRFNAKNARIRRWVPQGLRDVYNVATGHAIRFKGVYQSWEDAEHAARGYADNNLFKRIENAALAVKRGEAAWEQDGITHDNIPPDWPTLACLSQAALVNHGALTVLDYGGALGSSYFQARAYLTGITQLDWHIVEQPHIAASGRIHFQTHELQFHDSLSSCLTVANPNVALLSSVLQYLSKPYELIEEIIASPIEFLILDRHLETTTHELLTVQVIPPCIYPASYPAWLFDPEKFEATLSRSFEKQCSWTGKNPPIRGRGLGSRTSGQFWRRKPQVD